MKRAQTIMREKKLISLMKKIRRITNSGWVNYGDCQPWELATYTHDIVIDGKGIRVIFTRDAKMHECGWFKNPDYDRCYHLSLSYRTPDGYVLLPQDHKLSLELVDILFGDHKRWLWTESPASKIGKMFDVWHYRLMCDKNWQPIKPRKEVYSKEFTEKGWKSFSEIHGHKPDMVYEA